MHVGGNGAQVKWQNYRALINTLLILLVSHICPLSNSLSLQPSSDFILFLSCMSEPLLFSLSGCHQSPVSTVWLMDSGNFFMFTHFSSERCRNTCNILYTGLQKYCFSTHDMELSSCCNSEHGLLNDPSPICTHSKADLIVMEGSIECLDNGIDFRTACRMAPSTLCRTIST